MYFYSFLIVYIYQSITIWCDTCKLLPIISYIREKLMAIHFYYIALTLVFAFLGYFYNSLLSFVFYWVSISFLIISVAYLTKNPSIFRKNSDGRIPLFINILLWPFITGVTLYNAIARRRDSTDKMHQIDKGLFVATRLNTQDFTSSDISNIIPSLL